MKYYCFCEGMLNYSGMVFLKTFCHYREFLKLLLLVPYTYVNKICDLRHYTPTIIFRLTCSRIVASSTAPLTATVA
jgi:hypothetical protein